jgi:Tol biopolymer transport system component
LPNRLLVGLFLFITVCSTAFSQRDPVLQQIKVPHRYYYREMYLPQLTTGASAAAWSSDSSALVYSMAGSLWKQKLDSTIAEQLTAGAGYDYQPDWSPDGRWIIYASYVKDAIELWTLDLATKQSRQVTLGGAVNVEPRFSPDGRRVAFVSTSFKGHFHIFIGDFRDGELTNVQRVTGETRSDLSRYYYSDIDHEINPTWSRDGKELLFVSNHGHMYGTGGFWRMKMEPNAEPHEIHYEETAWKSRPEFSPDGKRMVYASYLGGQWHQLWVMPAHGGDAFPISYGEFDNVNPRWSPDGERIAFISNRNGNTSLWIQTVVGGAQREIKAKERKYLKPTGQLSITVLDPSGRPTAARLSITGADGRAYAPGEAWLHAEDYFDRSESAFESHYFHVTGKAEITVPTGRIEVEVMKGFEYQFEKRNVQVVAEGRINLTIRLQPLNIPKDANSRWVSGDAHVHMNYGGTYRNTPRKLVAQAAAENLPIVENLIVNKEQRIPDIAYFSPKRDSASTAENLLFHSQEYHTTYWGHLGVLNLERNYLLPGYSGYPNTAASSSYPPDAIVADVAHEQNALVGFAHPFDWIPDPSKDAAPNPVLPVDTALELPVDVALGKVDYLEVMGFDEHKATAAVWYRLLNCGFHLPAAAGTDAMANYASLRGPIGLNRVYAKVPAGPPQHKPWLQAIKQGQTFVTNGPLLGFTLHGHDLGAELRLPAGESKVKFKAWLRSFVPVDHLELICNGKTVRDLKINSDHKSADVEDTLPIWQSGWCLLHAYSDKAEHPVLDTFPNATTSPIYVIVDGSQLNAVEDAKYFIAWIDQIMEATNSDKGWDTEAEKSSVLELLNQARRKYVAVTK